MRRGEAIAVHLAFRKLADLYRDKAQADLEAELEIGALLEIDRGN